MPEIKDLSPTGFVWLLISPAIAFACLFYLALVIFRPDLPLVCQPDPEPTILKQDDGSNIPPHILELIRFEWTGGDMSTRDPHEVQALHEWRLNNFEAYSNFILSNK